MQKEVFESDIGESYVKAVHPSGLKIYILEKPQYNSSYAIFGTKYGSIDTCFAVNGEKVSVPEGIAHFLEYFTAQTVSKEQGIIGQEIRMYDDSPDWRVTFNMLGAMYKNHPVKIDIAGTVESIAQIDDKLLYSCYNTFYNLSNMFICIAGNVNTEKVLAQINGALKPSEPVEITRIGCDEPDTVQKNFVSQKMAVAYPMFCLGFKEPVSAPERTVKEKVAAEIKAEIERIKTDGIDKKLFSAVRCGMYGDAVRSFNSVESITMNLVNCAMFGCGLFDELKYLKNITAEDVLKRLQLLDADKSVLSVIEPTEEQR